MLSKLNDMFSFNEARVSVTWLFAKVVGMSHHVKYTSLLTLGK